MDRFCKFVLVFLFAFSAALAEEVPVDTTKADGDATGTVNEDETASFIGWRDVLAWPFVHVVQPVFGVLVYPVAQPIHYAFDNGVIEKSVDLITFGENRNILIYPVMNLKPGSSTMLGANYRHRSLLLSRDYLVLEPQFFANGDWYFSFRYTKQGILGLPLYGAFRYQQYWDSDAVFVVPGTKNVYVQPDSSINLSWRLSAPLTSSRHLNLTGSIGYRFNDASLPTKSADSILVSEEFPITARGLYQHEYQVPLELSLLFDNLDYPFAPTKGSRISLSGRYVMVGAYSGMDYDEYEFTGVHKNNIYDDDGANHNFFRTEFVYQQYIYLGKAGNFHMSPKEARENRRFYTDFNWDDALRIWYPDNVKTTLFERRVLAFQFRMINVWEVEKGEAPFNAFPYVNNRFPMRGYSNQFSNYHVMGFSMEYRWPVDRFVDGVLFDEYALHAPEIDDWSFERYYNSWGFGVRVRRPDMFWFRVQFGFHGLHGVNLVMTIAPEYR